MNHDKKGVHGYCNYASYGENYCLTGADRAGCTMQAVSRYALEPHILDFALLKAARRLGNLQAVARKLSPRELKRRLFLLQGCSC